MRKNGVNRKLTEIDGGVCAPSDFSASGFCAGILGEGREDLALIVSEKRVPTACVFSFSEEDGETVSLSKKHLRNGYARAIFVNSGAALLGVENGKKIAEDICVTLEKRTGIYAEETVIASTGEILGRFPKDTVLQGIDGLIKNLGNTNDNSLAAARGIMTTDSVPGQLSFSFELGDYTCRIGAIFKGSRRVRPNMATLLCFLTTDVNISSVMLQKALSSAVNDTLNLLDIDGVSSPNDTVCIMANGKAGNYKIDRMDSEYEKFRYVLEETLFRIGKKLAGDGVFTCRIRGVKSKTLARSIAKSVVGAKSVGLPPPDGTLDVEALLYAVLSVEGTTDVSRLQLSFVCGNGRFVFFEDGKKLTVAKDVAKAVFGSEELEIEIDLRSGNYSAVGIGRRILSKK